MLKLCFGELLQTMECLSISAHGARYNSQLRFHTLLSVIRTQYAKQYTFADPPTVRGTATVDISVSLIGREEGRKGYPT